MSIQWTLIAGVMYVELAVTVLLLLPFISPSRWHSIFKSRFLRSIGNMSHIYFKVFLAVLVLFFVDAIREMRKYSLELSEQQKSDHSFHLDAEMQAHMRLFRAQRNFYISGFSLFLWVVLQRLSSLLSRLSISMKESEASMKQAQSASAAAQQLLKQDQMTKEEQEEEECQKQVNASNEIKELKEENRRLHAEKDAALKQAKAVGREYDRLLAEHDVIQKKVTTLSVNQSGQQNGNNVEEYQKIVDTEWNLLYEKLDLIHKSGAKVVLSKLPIGDVATQYFADRDMFCAGRVVEEDLKRTMKACGGAIMTTAHDINDSVLGVCTEFLEKQIGAERFNLFMGCTHAKTCTIILRGGAEQFLEETERSLHDAIMIVRRALKHDSVVAGGGAIELEISKILREEARGIASKEQLFLAAYAKALEIIPRQLCDNAGFDSTLILNKLRAKHAEGGKWFGVDVLSEDIADNFVACVWEPAIVKINALMAASEAACLILSVDETIKSPRSGGGDQPQPPMRGRGRPMM